jgi:hypothetical protein
MRRDTGGRRRRVDLERGIPGCEAVLVESVGEARGDRGDEACRRERGGGAPRRRAEAVARDEHAPR